MIAVPDLINECHTLGIRFRHDGRGGLTIDAPRGALTADVMAKLKANKEVLLKQLQRPPSTSAPASGGPWSQLSEPVVPGCAATSLECEPTTVEQPYGQDTPAEEIDWPDPCPVCGNYELWQSGIGEWRCLHCDPPTASMRLLNRVAAIRARSGSTRQARRSHPSNVHCARCMSTELRDVPIHGGQSTRRDCAVCGSFVRFAVWYGKVVEKT